MRSIEIPQPEDRDFKYRLFEILPGALTWTILSLPIILGILSAKLATYFVIAYLLLWFARAIGIDIRSLQGWQTMNKHKNLPWKKLNLDLEKLIAKTPNAPRWHARNLRRVENNIAHTRIKPSEVYHAIIIAFYNESRDVLEPTVQSVLASDYDPKKIILILAYEQRGGPEIEATAKDLAKKYGNRFYHVESVQHPANIPGELIGKGGNITFAGRWLKTYLEEEKIDSDVERFV